MHRYSIYILYVIYACYLLKLPVRPVSLVYVAAYGENERKPKWHGGGSFKCFARIGTSTGRRPTVTPEPKLAKTGTGHGRNSRKMWLALPSARVMPLG